MLIRHPNHSLTGILAVATDHGPRQLPIEEGIVDWPSDVAVPAGWQTTDVEAPTALRARQLAAKREQVAQLAAELGLTVQDAVEDAPEVAVEDAPETAPEPKAPARSHTKKKAE